MPEDGLIVILVSPQGDANIGAAARAMKNFGFERLRLVNPACFRTKAAASWATHAADLLESAEVFENLPDAIADLSYAAGFTRRIGRARKKDMSLAAAAPLIADKIERGQVGVVFGREDDGLTNTDISLLDAVVTIPASEKFPSLNLAQAVIVSCYEIFNSIRRKSKAEDSQEIRGRPPRQEPIYASKEEILGLLARLGKTLARLEYKDSKGHALKTKIVNQFGKLFGRAGMLAKDIKMFEGLLERIDEKTGSKN